MEKRVFFISTELLMSARWVATAVIYLSLNAVSITYADLHVTYALGPPKWHSRQIREKMSYMYTITNINFFIKIYQFIRWISNFQGGGGVRISPSIFKGWKGKEECLVLLRSVSIPLLLFRLLGNPIWKFRISIPPWGPKEKKSFVHM